MKSESNHANSKSIIAHPETDPGSGSIEDIGWLLPGYSPGEEEPRARDRLIVPDRVGPDPTQRLILLKPNGKLNGKAFMGRLKEGREIFGWLLILLVMAAFMGLQIWFDEHYLEPLSMMLVGISVVIELGLIWKINRELKY